MTINRQREPAVSGLATRGVLRALAFYQRSISPAFGRRCRFLPTCSEYARVSIVRHGVGSGMFMAVRRLLRCQPFGSPGYDPVPLPESEQRPC